MHRAIFPGLLVAFLMVSACGPSTSSIALAGGSTRQIIAIETPNTLNIIGPPPGGALATAQKQQIAAFVDSYMLEGTGVLTMMVPTVREGSSASNNAIRQVYNAVITSGTDPDFLDRQRYYANSVNDFQLAYTTYRTSVPACDSDWSNLDASRSFGNQTPANFGCAVTVSIARMMADPRDVIAPAPSTAPDAYRRQTVLERYRKGQSTSSQRGEGEQGRVR